jgi:hypothetical protein
MVRQTWAWVASAGIAGGAVLGGSLAQGQHTPPARGPRLSGAAAPRALAPRVEAAAGPAIGPGTAGGQVETIHVPGQSERDATPPGGANGGNANRSRSTARTGVTVAILGKVHQPGAYRFESARGDLLTLVKAAGGLTPDASGSLRVVRGGRYINDSTTLHPRLRYDLAAGDMVVIGGRNDKRDETAGSGFDAAGRPIYGSVSNKDFLDPKPPSIPREEPVANIGVLGLGARPVVLRLPASGATLEEVLSRLNQPATTNALVTVVKPGAAPLGVRWSDAKNIGLVGDTLCVFDPRTLDMSSLPEFAEPNVIPGDGGLGGEFTGDRGAEARPDRARPVVVHSPFGQGNGRARSVEPRVGAAVGTNDAPAPLTVSTPLADTAPSLTAPSSTPDLASLPLVPAPDTVAAETVTPESVPSVPVATSDPAAAGATTADTVGDVNADTVADMASMPSLRDPGEGAIRVIPEVPLRIPGGQRRLTDESHLDREPLPPELAQAGVIGDNLVPPPMGDIDRVSSNTSQERLGMIAAGLALLSTIAGLATVAINERRRGIAVLASARPLSRLDALIENRLEVFEEPVRVPQNLVLYGSPLPQGDRYYIDPAQEVPAPHFPSTVENRPATVDAGTTVSTPTTSDTPVASDPAAKVIRLDGSHPVTDKSAAARPDMGLLDRVLLNKQRGGRS